MLCKIKDLITEAVIEQFAKEIHKNHLAYLRDYEAAHKRAKELLKELDKDGLPTSILKSFPAMWEERLVRLKPNDTIELTYKHDLMVGGVLTWVKLY